MFVPFATEHPASNSTKKLGGGNWIAMDRLWLLGGRVAQMVADWHTGRKMVLLKVETESNVPLQKAWLSVGEMETPH